MTIQVIGAFFATFFFSIMFNVNKSQLWVCGIVGACGWAMYLFGTYNQFNVVTSSFFASVVVSVLSHILAIYRRNPVTTYQISGIIPIVPGAGMYRTLLYLIQDELTLANEYLVETLQIAGAIAVAMLTVYSFSLLVTKLKLRTIKS